MPVSLVAKEPIDIVGYGIKGTTEKTGEEKLEETSDGKCPESEV